MSREWELFFFYENADINDTIRQDLINGITTSKNSLYYNRSDSAGVNDYENAPNALSVQIGIRYAIARWTAYRNTYTGNGAANTKERRVAVSQSGIQISKGKNGAMDIDVFYIPFFDYKKNTALSIPIGGSL